MVDAHLRLTALNLSMSIEPSVPVPVSGYERIFTAEIDVVTENELLVRGQMRDQRFSFEHVWRVRTPDYEVIEASAQQLAGDEVQYDPALCMRYANIHGVKIGRGFSKRILAELGEPAGAQEHLLTAIEMARVGQQFINTRPNSRRNFSQRMTAQRKPLASLVERSGVH
jgi:hypothetical protein